METLKLKQNPAWLQPLGACAPWSLLCCFPRLTSCKGSAHRGAWLWVGGPRCFLQQASQGSSCQGQGAATLSAGARLVGTA